MVWIFSCSVIANGSVDRHCLPPHNDGQVHGTPSRSLLRKVIDAAEAMKLAAGLLSEEDAKAWAREAIDALVRSRKLEATAQEREEAVEALAAGVNTPVVLTAAVEALARAWKPHWRWLSSPKQITEATAAAKSSAMPPRAELERIGRLKQRAWIASMWLVRNPPAAPGSAVPSSELVTALDVPDPNGATGT